MRFCIYIFGIVLGLLFQIKLMAQQIDFRCTEVDNAGDITFSWQASGLPSNYQYEIYGSTSKTGTYILLGTITNLAVTTFTHTLANGGNQQWFYVIKAVEQPPVLTGIEYLSDTIGSILFILDDLGRGIAALDWTRPTDPPLASQAKEFVINRQRNGAWSQWAKTDTSMYRDTVHVCGETLGYEIRLYDSTGCESISMIKTDFFTDFMAPYFPQLDSVSINPSTGLTELGWNPGIESDIVGYLVYIFVLKDSTWQVVDTVMGAQTTHYIDNKNDANDTIQQYRIAAIDTCRNASPMGTVHNTMLLNASVNKCDSTVTLSWNAYCGMSDSITGYRVWMSINGGPFILLDSVLSNQFSYIHRGVDPTGKYVYFVQAYNAKNGYSGSSSKEEVEFDYMQSTGNALLRYVSVVDNQDIEIVVFVPDTVKNRSVFLYKSNDGKATFSKIDTKSKISGTENYSFIDNNVDVQQYTYFYTVALTDECDHVFVYSDTANNIVLQMKESLNDEIAIAWKPYYGFKNRLDSYDILRKTQTEPAFKFAGNVPSTQLDYSENVWAEANQGGIFYYQVVANEDNSNIYGFQDKSYSNIVETTKEPITYIPNTFCPGSEIEANRVFKPVNSYVDAEEYVFSIYDRWGSLIYTTNDINMGWDGATNGKPAAAGVYTYFLTYRLDKKTMFKKQGRVTLIR